MAYTSDLPTNATTVATILSNLATTLAAPSGDLRTSPRVSQVAVVAGSGHHAADLAGQFGLNRATRMNDDLIVLYPGQQIAGRRFSLVLVTSDYRHEVHHSGAVRRTSLDRWLRDCVETRLASPDAKVIHL